MFRTTILRSPKTFSFVECQFNSGLHFHLVKKYGSATASPTSSDELKEIQERFKKVMKKVPQPVIVVTTAQLDEHKSVWLKRGVTCSSFSGISLKPAVISFAMNKPSRMHNLLLKTGRFAVHVLAQNQVGYAIHFSKPADDDTDQFENIPHEQDSEGTPILRDTNAVLQCRTYTVNDIGDHYVWYGEVLHGYDNSTIDQQPLLYYSKSFRSLGDEMFMHAFEDQTLPFEEWTHEAHLHMAYHYVRDNGREGAMPLIRTGIKKFNEQNKDKINRGYHETVTMFYIHVVADAINRCTDNNMTFEEFIAQHQWLTSKGLLFEYYSDETINKREAYTSFLLPDKKALPL